MVGKPETADLCSAESGSWCSRRNLTRQHASALDKLDRAQNLNYLERGSEHHLGGETAKPSVRAIAIALTNRQVYMCTLRKRSRYSFVPGSQLVD